MEKHTIPSDLIEKFEKETGKRAYWGNKLTKTFLKWQKGEKNYNIEKERVAFYIDKNRKKNWIDFAKKNGYSVLSKLIRNAMDFFINYTDKNLESLSLNDESFKPNLSFYLKQKLTNIKAYVQLMLRQKKQYLDEDSINLLKIILEQCFSFEKYIIENIEKKKFEEKDIMVEENHLKYDILLIEDNYETVSFLERYFRSLGYSCKNMKLGQEALNFLKQNSPSVVLLDIILPDMDGFDVIKEIRENSEIENLPVFFLTAIPRSEALNKMDEFGADGVISKPFNLEDFNVIYKFIKKD
ncbi:MAG: response regulator [Promethearchaeota archaeon]